MPDENHALSIAIPVELRSVKSVHSIGSLQFEGDLPAALFTSSSSPMTSQTGTRMPR